MSRFSWSAHLGSARRFAGDPRHLPYLCAFVALLIVFGINQAFWLTNDDVSMSLISTGNGIADAPASRLVLTNIAWGYLIQWLPDLGGIRAYTWVTYLALLASWGGCVWGLLRSEVDHRLAAVLLVLVYAPVIVHPQFTLVAGYLAAAGLLLGCGAIASRSIAAGGCAGLLVVLSGLVRADETALVLLVVFPLCITPLRAAWASDLCRRWLAVAGISVGVFLGFQLLDYFAFASGDWALYAQDYALRTGFTDFKFSVYFREHPALLKGSGFSVNDMRLISDWFYLDTRIFSPERLERLLDSLPWEGRLHASTESSAELLEPFADTLVAILALTAAVIALFHRERGRMLAALAIFALVMVLLWCAGRPAITRIYIPVFVALVLVGVTRLRSDWRRAQDLLLVAALVTTVLFCVHLSLKDRNLEFKSRQVQALACDLPKDSLIVIWGGSYPLAAEYPPFQPIGAGCPIDYYAFGEFSLAPYALDHLHRHTDGKDFVPAILAGQSFYFISDRGPLAELQTYFRQHYSVRLEVTPGPSNEYYSLYRVARERAPELRARAR
jgi:hypothetical protein